MSANKGGRPRNKYTDPVLQLISDKLRRQFVRDEFFFIPSNEVIEQCVEKNKKMKKFNLTVDQVIRTIRNYKEDLVAMMIIESKRKEIIKIKMPVYERKMSDEMKNLLPIIVDHFHPSFMSNEFPGRATVVGMKILVPKKSGYQLYIISIY